MCCNVGGYGALSVWTFVWAVIMILMNAMNALMPCKQAMEAWGIHQECSAMEADFFVQQSILFITLIITQAVVAAQKPAKVRARTRIQQQQNTVRCSTLTFSFVQMTMVKVLAPWLVMGAGDMAYFGMHGFGGQPFPPAVYVLNGLMYATFAFAFVVHKEQTGKPLL